MCMVVIVSFKAVYASLSMKLKPWLIPHIFKSSVNDVKSLIIYLSLLFFISVVRMALQSYTYITYMYLLPLLEVVGKCTHRSEQILPSLVFIGSTVMQYTPLNLIFYSRYVSGGFSLVDCNPCLLLCRCPIVVFLDFSRCFLMSFSVRPGHVFRKSCLIALRRLAVVGMKSSACKYWASYVLKFMPECCLPHFLIVVPPWELPIFMSSCYGPFDYFFSILLDVHFLFVQCDGTSIITYKSQ